MKANTTSAARSIFSRILVGIDGSEAGFDACRQVARLAERDTEIDAVAVVHLGPAVAAALDAAHLVDVLEEEAEDALEHAVAILGGRAHKRYLDGFVASALTDELERFDATLIALGTHEHPRAAEMIFGGVSGEVLHKAPCSVLIARRRPAETFPRTIVVGHDGSPQAEAALAVARELEHRFGSTVRVIASPGTGAKPVAPHPVAALVEAARDADLVVLGSRGLHGVRALGSVSERVAHDASSSVLVVRIGRPSEERSRSGSAPGARGWRMPGGKAPLPPRWFIEAAWHLHRRIVDASRGRKGLWAPRPAKWGALRLTTTGRRSGEPRSVILGYYEDGPNFVSMAMNGWGAAEPDWWLNLQADPHATVELAGGIRRGVLGRPAIGGERQRLWQRWRELDKNLDDYAARRPHETAVVVLEPPAG